MEITLNGIIFVTAFVIALINWKYGAFLVSLSKQLRMLYASKTHDRKYKKGLYSYLNTFEATVNSSNRDQIQFITAETGDEMTLGQLDELANQIAVWGLFVGSKQMDTIAILMQNTPDYVAIFLGFGKIGVSSALINANLSGNPLIHSCDVSLKNSDAKILIVDAELRIPLANDIVKLQALGINVHYWSSDLTVSSVKQEVVKLPKQPVPLKYRNQVTANDPFLFIFTSGTTGMPKACKISHSRYFLSTLPYRTLCDLTVKDRIYTVLPLYHSAAGLLGVGAALSSGATMVLRKKFSASNFTSDCLKHRITSFQYIGELCRYLIAAPGNVLDFQLSSIRTCFGNGMRPDVWVKFQKRYSVKHVVEFYGATEGNASLFNNFDKVGSLGFVPRLLDALHPLKILRTEADDQTKPLRDANGKCVECRVGEVGLLVSQIYPSRKFDGYTDAKATNDKILRDVLVKEDMFFNTGDLLYRDGPGFFYWSDRIGDTFRWKGENCATSEVGAVLAACMGVKDVTVYGVSVPGCDGRAGMGVIAMSAANASGAAGGIQTDAASKDVKTVDVSAEVVAEMLKDVVRNCKQHLASYSRPLFLRVKASGTQLLTTTTFKHIKTDLVKEGFNPSLVGDDQLFYFHAKSDAYVPLTAAVFKEITDEKIRF